jgi:hypothetical protein
MDSQTEDFPERGKQDGENLEIISNMQRFNELTDLN